MYDIKSAIMLWIVLTFWFILVSEIFIFPIEYFAAFSIVPEVPYNNTRLIFFLN